MTPPKQRYGRLTNLSMSILLLLSERLNDDPEIVKTIREGLKRTGGYCPCRLARTEENRCMCKEFKDQIADPNFEGYCHCRLYYKEK